MSCKLPGDSHLAAGYWGRSIHRRILAEQTPDKILVLERDKLLGMGRPVYLYLPAADVSLTLLANLGSSPYPCTCEKETAATSDERCFTCYGTKLAPGYYRFLHHTIYFSSAEYALFTLVNCAIDRRVKPNRILLDTTATSATIVTQDKTFTNPNDDDWTFRSDDFLRDVGNTVSVEFSTDAGVSWTSVAAINGPNKPTGASGTVRFRITLTRASTSTKSPAFEVLRMWRPRSEHSSSRIISERSQDSSFAAGQILIARSQVSERTSRDVARGRLTEHSSDACWTSGLSFFDSTITVDTPDDRILDREAGPHPFYQSAYGIDLGTRYALYAQTYNQELLVFTHQAFSDRRTQDAEAYSLVYGTV